jgi:hypothetical protein
LTPTRPDPMVPAEVDLRDFSFLPLDVLRLRDSDLASSPDAEVFRCSVLSWCVAWHQLPAASLPNDDTALARLLGFGRDIRGWKKVRAAGGLRGWVECSDGRLYHPVVAEKAAEAWDGKLAQRWRTEFARVKKHNQRHKLEGDAAVQMPDFIDWKAAGCPQGQPLRVPGTVPETSGKSPQGQAPAVPRETASKGQGEGQRQGQGQGDLDKENPPGSSSAEPTLPGFGEGSEKAARPTIPCPYAAIVEAYHRELPALPRVKLQDGPTWVARQKAMRSLWAWVLSSRKSDGSPRATTGDEGLAWIAGYFRRASQNDFVMGRTARSAEHANWRADFDFLLSQKGLKQVIEKTQEAAA